MNCISLPPFDVKVIEDNGKHKIYDIVRKKYVALTPEEWVRQHFVNYLVSKKRYPLGIIANEVQIKLHNTLKRCDTVVYNKYLEPIMIIEYKAPSIELTTNVFDQVLRYNMALRVRYLVVTNGIKQICCDINYSTQQYNFLSEVPDFPLV